ncbi:MAG: hypothetical protein Q9208_008172 [Pyrenodesmia sp. 3 TL-2023]
MTNYQFEEMTDRHPWTKPQLERMILLKRAGATNKEIFQTMRREYGVPKNLGEVNAEMHFLNGAPNPGMWNPAMESRVKALLGQGMNSKDITTELFHEFAQPVQWQETYKKIQQMKLQGRL